MDLRKLKAKVEIPILRKYYTIHDKIFKAVNEKSYRRVKTHNNLWVLKRSTLKKDIQKTDSKTQLLMRKNSYKKQII